MSRCTRPIRAMSICIFSGALTLAVMAQEPGPAPQYQEAPPAPPNAVVQGTIALIQLTDRIVISPYAAKRLSMLLQGVVGEYEKRFGTLNIEAGAAEGKK